jgi:hypothetical protein
VYGAAEGAHEAEEAATGATGVELEEVATGATEVVSMTGAAGVKYLESNQHKHMLLGLRHLRRVGDCARAVGDGQGCSFGDCVGLRVVNYFSGRRADCCKSSEYLRIGCSVGLVGMRLITAGDD